jgi:hypothetical protein
LAGGLAFSFRLSYTAVIRSLEGGQPSFIFRRRRAHFMADGIREVTTQKDSKGNYTDVRLVFGPHYFVELHLERSGKVRFVLGATHHGFKADASQVGW